MKKAFILFLVFTMIIFSFQSCVNSPKESDVLSEDNSKNVDTVTKTKMLVEKGNDGIECSYEIPVEAYLFGMFEVVSTDHDENGAVSELKLVEVYAEPTFVYSVAVPIEVGAKFKLHEPYKMSEVDGKTVMTFNGNNFCVKTGLYLPFIKGRRYVAAIIRTPSVKHYQYCAAPAFDFITDSGYKNFDFVLSGNSETKDLFDLESRKVEITGEFYKVKADAIKLIFESFEKHYKEGKKPDINAVIDAIDKWVEKQK